MPSDVSSMNYRPFIRLRRRWLFRKRWRALLCLLVGLLTIVVAACGEPSAPPAAAPLSGNCQRIEHAAGTTELCVQPQRVAALSPYILDMLLALGVEPVGFGAADMSEAMLRRPEFDDPPAQIPYLGQRLTTEPVNLGDRHSPSLETLTQVQPDLILGEVWQGNYALLSQIAPTILVDDEPGGWQSSIQILAQALDKEPELAQVKATYQAAITQAQTQLSSIVAEYPRVLLLSSGNLTGEIYTYPCSEFSRLLEAIGFQLVSLDNSSSCDSPTLSLEVVPQVDADIVFVVAWDAEDQGNPEGWRNLKQDWNQVPLLQKMPVTQAGRVYFIDAHLSTLRGPIAAEIILENYLNQLSTLG